MWTDMTKVIHSCREYASTTNSCFVHRVCLCVMYDSHGKQRLFPYALLIGSVIETHFVFCAVRNGSLYKA